VTGVENNTKIMKKLNFALVGCGNITSKKHLPILTNDLKEEINIVAICDIKEDRSKQLSDQYNIPFYTDYHQMMREHPEIHVVEVLTESGNHARHTIDLAQYGKHIIVEKPMALTLADADKMIETCDKNACRLFVVKQNRYNLPIQKLKEAIDQGRFGKIFMGTVRVRWCRRQNYYDHDAWRGTWKMDGGVFANQASHHLDLLEWLVGDIESVFAKSINALANIEAEDTGTAMLKFTNGALGMVEATTAVRPTDIEGSISILGEKGMVEVSGFAVNEMKIWQFEDKQPDDDEVVQKYRTDPPNVYGFGHYQYLKDIVRVIKENKKALVDGLEGRKSLELINAIYESIETDKEVFLHFKPKKCKLGVGD